MGPEFLTLERGVVDLRRGALRAPDGSTSALTTKEAALLAFLAAREGQDVPREDLLEHVWGYHRAAVSRAIDSAVQRLRAKIERDAANPRHLLTVTGLGYRFVGRGEGTEAPAARPRRGGLIGRADDLAVLERLLADHRLVTIVGPAGIGKTALSGAVGGPTLMVALESAQTADDVRRLTAAALGSPLASAAGDDDLDAALGSAMGGRRVVLDNVEQVIDAVAAIVPRWLAAHPDLRVLATSREPLRIGPEAVLELAPLGPDAAVELFLVRAAQARPNLDGSAVDAAAVRAIADRLDGLPLALELAAARMGVLSAEGILDRLEDRFRLLVSRRRDVAPRLKTLRGALDWSWDLLSPPQRNALAALSVFQGSFDLESAEAVIDDGSSEPVLDLLEALRDRSLLREVDSGGLGMLESVRAYAAERLVDATDARPAHARHARFFIARAARWEAAWEGPEGVAAAAALKRDAEDLGAAAARATDPAQRARAVLARDLALRGELPPATSLAWLDQVEATALPSALRGRWLTQRSHLLLRLGRAGDACADAEAARALPDLAPEQAIDAAFAHAEALRARGCLAEADAVLEVAVTAARDLPDRLRVARGGALRGLVLLLRRQLGDAIEATSEGLREAQAGGHCGCEVEATRILGRCLAAQGRWAEAVDALETALEASEVAGDLRKTSMVLQNISTLLDEAPAEVRARFADATVRALEIARALDDPRLIAGALRNRGIEVLEEGRAAEAEAIFDEVLRRVLVSGDRLMVGRAHSDRGVALLLQDRLNEARASFEAGLEASRLVDDGHYLAIGATNAAVVHHLGGDLAAARAGYATAVAAADAIGPRLLGYVRLFAMLVDLEEGGDITAALAEVAAADPTAQAIRAVVEACAAGTPLPPDGGGADVTLALKVARRAERARAARG